MHKCIFLDRDGVINKDNVNYVYQVEKFEIQEGVLEALAMLKQSGFLLVIITNQSGIAKQHYTHEDVMSCFAYLQSRCNQAIDAHYYAPYHPDFDSVSLTRKPDSLMIEKAIAKFRIDVGQSWFVGDSERDLIAAKKVNLRTIYLPELSAKYEAAKHKKTDYADFEARNLLEAVEQIVLKAC